MTALITVCRSARLMPAAYQFYCAILRRFPARGGPPDHTQLDATTGGIRAAYPFSGLPTPHRVLLAPDAQEVAEQQVFAMCALDALGIPLMLHRAATILSEDALTHMPI